MGWAAEALAAEGSEKGWAVEATAEEGLDAGWAGEVTAEAESEACSEEAMAVVSC